MFYCEECEVTHYDANECPFQDLVSPEAAHMYVIKEVTDEGDGESISPLLHVRMVMETS